MSLNVNLWSRKSIIVLPGTGPVSLWGFSLAEEGDSQLPGPQIDASKNEQVRINLTNQLNVPVSLVFPGQDFTPEPVKDARGQFISYNRQAATGGTASYIFTPNRPGIFLYESGTSQEQQIQMGLYGVMVVRPEDFDPAVPKARTAYGPGTGTEFDVEKVVVIGEIDTKFHQSLEEGTVLPGYNPDYFTINGRCYPDSPEITVVSGQKVLLRLINAGFLNHNLRFLGITPRVLAGDSWPLKSPSLDGTFARNTLTLGSGQSFDVVFTAPVPGKYLLYDRDLNHAVNNNQFPGGILTIINVV